MSAFNREMSADKRRMSAYGREMSAYKRQMSADKRRLSASKRQIVSATCAHVCEGFGPCRQSNWLIYSDLSKSGVMVR